MTIEFDDFLRVDIRAGTIVRAEAFPETLPGRQVAAVVNFPLKQIDKFISEVLVVGFPDGDGEVVLVDIDRPVAIGARLFLISSDRGYDLFSSRREIRIRPGCAPSRGGRPSAMPPA